MFPWVTVKFFGLPLHLWIYLLAVVFFCIAVYRNFRHHVEISRPACLLLCAIIIFGVALGGKLFELVDNFAFYAAYPERILTFMGHGINGGLVVAFFSACLFLKIARKPVLSGLDVIAYYMLWAMAIGRMACLLTADGDYGTPTDLPWGMTFLYGYYPTSVTVHPVPAYEILILVATALVLKMKVVGRFPAGWTLAMAVAGYSLQRFLMEFIRLNRVHALGMTLAQWICLIMFLISVGLLLYLFFNRKNTDLQLEREKDDRTKPYPTRFL